MELKLSAHPSGWNFIHQKPGIASWVCRSFLVIVPPLVCNQGLQEPGSILGRTKDTKVESIVKVSKGGVEVVGVQWVGCRRKD